MVTFLFMYEDSRERKRSPNRGRWPDVLKCHQILSIAIEKQISSTDMGSLALARCV